MSEFVLIEKYFSAQGVKRPDVLHGIGDDAAVITPPIQQQIVITTDTLVAGIHFLESTLPDDVGYKSLAVNLSDLAAMGATPAWLTLALTLPDANEDWIKNFCTGFFALANRYNVQLIGGNLSRGPLTITVQAIGLITPGEALLRANAKPDDLIYVTGTLGDAGLALQFLQKKISIQEKLQQSLLSRLNRPEPQILVGEQIRTFAHAAIDISDGLIADLSHILQQSNVGATVYVDSLPFSAALLHTLSMDKAIPLALTAGDDYELCFTIAKQNKRELEKKLSALQCRYTCIGFIKKELGLNLQYENGTLYQGPTNGYQHF